MTAKTPEQYAELTKQMMLIGAVGYFVGFGALSLIYFFWMLGG